MSFLFSRYVVISVVFVSVAIFLQLDADFLTYFVGTLLPYEETSAYANQNVWITGASSGIGESLALQFAKAGARVAISARRVDRLETLANRCIEVSNRKDACFIVPLDVTDADALAAATSSVISALGSIDILILNAGRSQRLVASDTDIATTKQLFELNFFSYVALTQLVLPYMVNQNSGHIIVMSSLSGKIPTPIASTYSATKFALNAYFDTLRSEVSKLHNISVQLILPGPVESEISDHTIRDSSYPVSKEGRKMPTRRCTDLIVRVMKYKDIIYESWISDQPFLSLTYVYQFFPYGATMLFTKLIGPARVELIRNGGNVYDIKALFGIKK